MAQFDPREDPVAWGSWQDAEALRRWAFARRTPEQRLQWLVSALEVAYASGALKLPADLAREASVDWPAGT
jgi:hypothetical protein